jgi:nucleoporin SEH1
VPATHGWIRRATLVDAKDTLVQVKFGPRQLGLVLACLDGQGTLRIYEAADAIHLSQWPLTGTIDASATRFAWSPAGVHGTTLALTTANSLTIVSRTSTSLAPSATIKSTPARDVAWAPQAGRSFDRIAVALADDTLVLYTYERSREVQLERVAVVQSACLWRLSWNATGTLLSGTGADGSLSIYTTRGTGKLAALSLASTQTARDATVGPAYA